MDEKCEQVAQCCELYLLKITKSAEWSKTNIDNQWLIKNLSHISDCGKSESGNQAQNAPGDKNYMETNWCYNLPLVTYHNKYKVIKFSINLPNQ